MQKKKKPLRSVRLRRLLRLHAIVTVFSLSAYFLVAFFDPGFLSYDVRQKYHALADELIAVTKKGAALPLSSKTAQTLPNQPPLISFSFAVENNDTVALQGQNLQVVLKITDIIKQYDGTTVPIHYSVTDEKGRTIFSTVRETFLKNGKERRESFPIPLYTDVGKYSLQAEILFDQATVSKTAQFSVKALPLLQTSGGTIITYAEIVRNVGWLTLVLVILFLFWSLLFIREYWMYLHAIRFITEQQLRKAGFLSKRKGVVR